MRLVSLAFAFVMVLGLTGAAWAQTPASTVPAPQQAAASTAPVQLWQIFEAPRADEAWSLPQAQPMSCTLFQCRQPCKAGCTGVGCISVCDSLVDCTCHCDC
jgi:hypothetical protein